jgi:biopolymer transport protein TolQ
MLDLDFGDELPFEAPLTLLLQIDYWEMLSHSGPVELAILGVLFCFSLYSWAVIFSKLTSLRRARQTNSRFLRAFRKANAMEAVLVASERYRPSPLVAVFDFGYEELERQVKARGAVHNPGALERTLQIGVSEEMSKLDRNMSWLATTASVAPFIGLMGTVIGIIQAFLDLTQMGTTSLKAVGPGISHALVATAVVRPAFCTSSHIVSIARNSGSVTYKQEGWARKSNTARCSIAPTSRHWRRWRGGWT